MRNFGLVIVATLAAGPVSAQTMCFAQGVNLICYEAAVMPVQPAPLQMSVAAETVTDYALDAAYAVEPVPVYSAPMMADPTAMFSVAANPYESVDTIDAFGATSGGTCMTASLDPNSVC